MYKIFGSNFCPFCRKAKELASANNLDFNYIEFNSFEEKEAAKKKYNHKTIPIILLNDTLIGGCDEFEKHLNSVGKKSEL